MEEQTTTRLEALIEEQYDQWQDLFGVMVDQLTQQTLFLEKLTNIQIESVEDQKRRDEFDKLVPPSEKPEYDDVPPVEEVTKGISDRIFSFFGGLGGLAGITAMGLGGLGVVFQNSMSDFVSGVFKSALDDIELMDDVSEGLKQSISDNLGEAVTWGAIGRVIGGKVGFFIGMTGFLEGIFDKFISENKDTIFGGIAEKIGPDKFSWIAASASSAVLMTLPSMIGGIVGSNAVKGAIGSSVRAVLTSPATIAGAARKVGKFALRGGPMAVLGGLIVGTVSNILIDKFVDDPETANIMRRGVNNTLSGAMIGGMIGGPIGAIVGAVAGLALTGLEFLYNWFKDKNSKMNDRLREQVKDMGGEKLMSDIEGEILAPVTSAGKTGADTSEIVAGQVVDDLGFEGVKRSLKVLQKDPGNKTALDVVSTYIDNMYDQIDDILEDNMISPSEQSILDDIYKNISDIDSMTKHIVSDDSSGLGARINIERELGGLISDIEPYKAKPMIYETPQIDPIIEQKDTRGKIIEDGALKQSTTPANVAITGGTTVNQNGGNQVDNSTLNITQVANRHSSLDKQNTSTVF